MQFNIDNSVNMLYHYLRISKYLNKSTVSSVNSISY